MSQQYSQYFTEINWFDPPILGAITVYSLLLILGFAVRHNRKLRTVFFVICMGVSVCMQKLGDYFAEHWKDLKFSRNYFEESNVVFIFIFCLPPLFVCIVLLSFLIGDVSSRLIIRLLNHNQSEQKKNE